MGYRFPPNARADALCALDGMKLQHEQLREEIQQRAAKAGKRNSAPLEREAFKAEARRRFSQ